MLEGADPTKHYSWADPYGVFYLARDLLGLTDEQARELFYRDNWPADLAAQYEIVTDDVRLAHIASDAIDRFIEKHTMEEADVSVVQLASAGSGDTADTPIVSVQH